MLLAKLFAKPANVIVLDEPTNDLDAETLELLEERLVQYHGTLLLVSHDREFLNNVVTSTIVFEPDGVRRSTSAATTTGCGNVRIPPARDRPPGVRYPDRQSRRNGRAPRNQNLPPHPPRHNGAA